MSQDRVRSVDTVIVDLPLKRLQRFSAIGAERQSVVIIRIKSEDGAEGIGESVTPSGPWWGGESVETIKLMIDRYIAPEIIGSNPFSLSSVCGTINGKVYGNNFAKAGVEMALLDLQGKLVGKPLYDLLGGKTRSSVACSWPLATGEAGAEIDEARAMIDKGWHKHFKLKMGALALEADVERACTVARALEGEATVRVDPNEEWDETAAKWALPRLKEAGIVMVEQPLPRWNLEGMARLTARSGTAIMADESVRTPQEALRAVGLRAADVVSLKIMKAGGIKPAMSVAEIASAGGLSLYMGTFLESSIGTAAGMQLCASLGALPFGGELCGPNLLGDDIAAEPARYENFELQIAEGPGLGVALDEEKLRSYRRDRDYRLHPVQAIAGT